MTDSSRFSKKRNRHPKPYRDIAFNDNIQGPVDDIYAYVSHYLEKMNLHALKRKPSRSDFRNSAMAEAFQEALMKPLRKQLGA